MAGEQRLAIAIAGAGWIAQRVHLPYFAAAPETLVVATYDEDEQRAHASAAAADSAVVQTYEDLLAARPDVVVIATPPSTHAKLVEAALDANCHVICEKPLALSAAEAEALLSRARGRGVQLHVCMTSRFRSDVQQMKRQVDAGAIGEPRFVRAAWLRASGVPRTRGGVEQGVLWDLGSHLVDLVYWITGWRCADRVSATALKLADEAPAAWQSADASAPRGALPEMTAAVLDFGAEDWSAHLEVAWASAIPHDTTEFDLFGTEATMRLRTVFGWSPDRQATFGNPLVIGRRSVDRWQVVERFHDRSHSEYERQNATFLGAITSANPQPLDDALVSGIATLEQATHDAARAWEETWR